MADAVQLSIEQGVADVRLNRPDSLNAVDEGIFQGLHRVLEVLREDSSVRAVVLSGNGRGFCSGLDFANFSNMLSGDLTREGVADAYEDRSPAGANYAQQLGWGWQELPMPVIAAVHGAAVGAGMNIALGADIRIVHPQAKLGLVEINYGLIADMSATQALRRLVGLDRAKELVFTGRKISGTEALEYGLATALSEDPLDAALEMATTIAARNPDAIRAAKTLLNDSALVSVHDGLVQESDCSRDLLGTPNQLEAVMAYFEKRTPAFKDQP